MRAASIAIVNGRMWRAGAPATALAVATDVIQAVGSDAAVMSMCDRRTEVIDARGATVLPAFNDAHVHFVMGSRSLFELDLYGAQTQEEVEVRVTGYASAHDRGWIVGRGWFYSAFPGGMPTVELLDRLVPDRPAYLESFDAHTAWANTKALELAGGGTEGVLKEAAMLGVARHIPPRTKEHELDALRSGMRLAASRGIGSVQEAGEGQEHIVLWEALHDAGELTLRVRLGFDLVPGLDAEARRRSLDAYDELRRRRAGDRWITAGILKAFADGVVESRTAALIEPYAGTAELGEPLWERDELADAVRLADERSWQVQVHAIGDAAIRQALDAFAGAPAGRRHRVEHIEAPAPRDVGRFAQLGVVASMQPQHAEPNRNLFEVWAPNLGPARAANGWPWRSILAFGAPLAFGTDWPVVPLDPAASLHMAITRQTRAGEPEGGWLPGERLTLEQAVAAWTSGSAYAEHAENSKGALAEGMLADIAVLDRALESTAPAEVADLEVMATIVGGRIVHRR